LCEELRLCFGQSAIEEGEEEEEEEEEERWRHRSRQLASSFSRGAEDGKFEL
jgi:hypothetical protein